MNKSDLILKLSEKQGISDITADQVVDLIFKGFIKELENGGRIEIRGFGSFTVREYGSYMGRNPKSGKSVKVKPKRMPFFKVGKELKGMVDA